LPAHYPGGMLERPLDRDGRELLFWRLPKWAAGSSQDQAADRTARPGVEALKNRGVLAIDGQNLHPVLASFAHDDLARHDEDFLGGHGDVFPRANGGERGTQTSRAD